MTVRFGEEAYTATEGGAAARVSIHLSEEVEVEPLVVQLVSDSTAAARRRRTDYSVPLSVTVRGGRADAGRSTVVAVEDTDDDDGESVSLSFVNDPQRPADRPATGRASATVALEPTTTGPGGWRCRSGRRPTRRRKAVPTRRFSVQLDKAPGRSVTVPLDEVTQLGNASAADYSGIPIDRGVRGRTRRRGRSP